jgi:DNA helicase-2/ATP-dependent DNA helicase PcrA
MTVTPSPEQQAVMDYPLLPLRVTAGAGTGKTTTMALRLAAIIRRCQIAPEEALGITFTNKAAGELADRLRIHLPELASTGRQVEVTTYHGFARSLLAEFGPLVGVERGVEVITPGYARQLLREALGAGPRVALDLTLPGRRVDELVTLAGQLGDHLCSPSDLLTVATGEDDEVSGRRFEMAEILQEYAARKRRLGVIDYDDMVFLSHRLVEAHPQIAENLRNRYRVALLDEYQDTNPAQRELFRRIFGDGFPVTAVGDADQTIYEWRGASLHNFAAFPQHFPNPDGTPAATLTLAHNRRSGRRIIDLANLVRSEIEFCSELEELLPLEDAAEGSVAVGWFRTALDEAEWIARDVLRLHDEDGRSWRDVGILFRRHSTMGLIRDALERLDVPVEVASLGGLLEVPEVADIYAWLRILGRPDDTPALLRVLLGCRYRLGLGDLEPVARRLAAKRRGSVGGEGRAPAAMVEVIDHLDDLEGLTADAAARLAAFRNTFRALLEAAQSVSLADLCRHVLESTGAWQEVEALGDSARLSARLNIHRFLDLAESWSPLQGPASLQAFLEYLDLLRDEGTSEELDTARIGGEDAVALITVHRAKGLEWPAVYLPALAKDVFPSKARALEDPTSAAQFLPHYQRLDRDAGADLPEGDTEGRDLIRLRHQDQEWRTAYVAVTRAKETLVVTGAFWTSGKKPKQRSKLIELAGLVEGVREVAVTDHPGEPPLTLRPPTITAEAPDQSFPGGWRKALREAIADPTLPGRIAGALGVTNAYEQSLEELMGTLNGLPAPGPGAPAGPAFRTSVSGLVTFASCPRRFHWSEVDRLPTRPSTAMRRGLDIHRRIELHNRGSVAPEQTAESGYEPAGEGRQGVYPARAFAESRFAGMRPRFVEAPFSLRIADTRIAGRIDAIYEPEPGLWEIVDFKTGRRHDDPAQEVQLEAYALAAVDAGFAAPSPEHIRVAFVFLGSAAEEVAQEVDKQWLTAARRHLEQLVGLVLSGTTAPTPSAACRRCDFVGFCEEGTTWARAHHG